MLKRILIRLGIVLLLGIPLFVLRACNNIQGPIPPAENGTQWVWYVYGIISYIIIFSSEAKDTYPSTSNDKKPESVDGKTILKRFFIRLAIVVALGLLFYLLFAWNNSQMPTPPPGYTPDNDTEWLGWAIVIAGALCILFYGLKRPKEDSSSYNSPYEEPQYIDYGYDDSTSSDDKDTK